MMGRLCFILLSILLPALISPVRAGTFHYPTAGLSITLPPGWVEMPVAVTESLMSSVGVAAPGRGAPRRRLGFQPHPGRGWMRPPHILVAISHSGRIDENRLQRIDLIDPALPADFFLAAGAPAGEVRVGRGQYDPRRHLLWHRLSLPYGGDGVGGMEVLSGTRLTRDGHIRVVGYAPAADYAGLEPLFRQVIESLELEEALRYRPGERLPWFKRLPASLLVTLLAFACALWVTRWLGRDGTDGRGGAS